MTAVTPSERSRAKLMAPGDTLQACLLRQPSQMAAGMKIQIAQLQLLAASYFFQKGVAGFLPAPGLGMAQVDQVAVVRQDHLRTIAVFSAMTPEIGNWQHRSAVWPAIAAGF